MSQTEKAGYFRVLKSAGVNFPKHYREYNTAELKEAYDKLIEERPDLALPSEQPELPLDLPTRPSGEAFEPGATAQQFDPDAMAAAYDDFVGHDEPKVAPPPEDPAPQTGTLPPLREANPEEMAGERQNSQPEDEPIRVDEQGRIWYQEEVRKPAFPKPRGRRVLKYMDSGVEKQVVKSGDYIEEFEVAGTKGSRPSEVKITLPSYQVGIYKDPRFPFRIHVYNDNQGFDLFEVQEFYGGPELVPAEAKRKYVENVLCYDIRTTVRAIESEFRRLQLAGKVD